MPKTKRSAPPSEGAACGLVPTESPVPGVGLELALLLVQAVKARRKFLSKSSAPVDEDTEKETLRQHVLQGIQNTVDDKTTSFINELHRQVERSTASASTTKTTSSRRNIKFTNAPTSCLEFLLETLSDGSNSFHLRRSALALAREILERSSDARAFLTGGRHLLDFVSMVEGVENDQQVQEEDEPRGSGNGGEAPTNSSNNMAARSLFQLEAMELIHFLGSKFGRFYTQFTVASRLLGDVSVNFSMNNANLDSNDNEAQDGRGGRQQSQRANMRIMRRERDIALEHGEKACQSLERMIERADGYFPVLVPRFGGFNAEPLNETNKIENQVAEITSKFDATDDSKPAAEGGELNPIKDDNAVDHDEEDDDDSIDWEEGDADLSDNGNFDEDMIQTAAHIHNEEVSNQPSSIDHQTAVEQTMELIGRGGTLLDGELAVQVGVKSQEAEATAKNNASETPDNSANSSTLQHADTTSTARSKLQKLVQKLSSQRLPRLNRWIHALSRADGMEERAVVDPATGNEGPVSLVLLSEEKRAVRGQLLRRMMKVRGEIEGVLRSAATLRIRPEGDEEKKDDDASAVRAVKNGGQTGQGNTARMKRAWMPGTENLTVPSRKKKSKTSRFKVIYRKT